MPSEQPPRLRRRDFVFLLLAGCLPLPWMLAHHQDGLALTPELVACLAGMAILGGAFLLTWATALAERDLPQAIAILVLALVILLPDLILALPRALMPRFVN